jgi:hypothetical protein
MYSYQVVYPFLYSISANNFNEAVKNFTKMHRHMNLSNIIVSDQLNHRRFKLKYFRQKNKDKVGFNAYPYNSNIVVLPDGNAISLSPNNFLTTIPAPVAPPMVAPNVILTPTTPTSNIKSSHPKNPPEIYSQHFLPRIINLG